MINDINCVPLEGGGVDERVSGSSCSVQTSPSFVQMFPRRASCGYTSGEMDCAAKPF